ncbi:hypothetical protein JXA85_02285, partial [Candidatus Woesearchaeota archaeon]|nr:hypothetical protein [Candidatus Woesearchaeota archaeon]
LRINAVFTRNMGFNYRSTASDLSGRMTGKAPCEPPISSSDLYNIEVSSIFSRSVSVVFSIEAIMNI